MSVYQAAQTLYSKKFSEYTFDMLLIPGNLAKSTLAINNLPKTFVHGDVFRLLRKAQINERQVKGGVYGGLSSLSSYLLYIVHLDYYRFLRTGKAYVSFNDQNQAEDAIAQMRQAKNIVGKLDVFLKGPIYPPGRSRGVKGREAAVQRGAIYGEGADAGISQRGRGVVIYGLPRNVRQEELAQLAQNNLVQLEGGGQTNYNIYKLEDM